MASTRNGAESAELQSLIQWAPQSYTTVRRFEGTRSYMESLAVSAQNSGLKYVLSPGDGPNATLDIEYSGSTTETENPISTEWSVTTRAAQVPIEEHDNYRASIAALTRAQLIAFRQMLDGAKDSEIESADLATIIADADLVELISKYLGGVTSYLRPEPVLTVQYRYQATAAARPDMGNVGTVYEKSVLAAELNIPLDILAKMPEGEYLCEDVDWGAGSDGSRVLTQTFRFATQWDPDLYTHAT